jgi:hypothetical protein
VSLELPEEPKFEGKGQMADWQYEQETGEIQKRNKTFFVCAKMRLVNTATYASITSTYKETANDYQTHHRTRNSNQ